MTTQQPKTGEQTTSLDLDARRTDYKEVIARQERQLLWAARRMCGGQEDRAQDLVQDALVRGYEAFVDGRFQPGTNERAWLLRIVTNLFINDYQKRKKWDSDVDVDLVATTSTDSPFCQKALDEDVPHLALLVGVLDEPLEQALARLTADQRACVVLVDIEGVEYQDAATALEIPIGTVRSRLSRARLHLHALLFNYARDRRMV